MRRATSKAMGADASSGLSDARETAGAVAAPADAATSLMLPGNRLLAAVDDAPRAEVTHRAGARIKAQRGNLSMAGIPSI
jgi:hypothetical protein